MSGRGRTAFTRPVSAALAQCELTHIDRSPLDIGRARAQHRDYCAALREAGCTVVEVPVADDLPDAVFIEDTALALDDRVIVTRPGAPSRRPEVDAVATILARHLPVTRMTAPATLDGGDVLRIGSTLYVGTAGRTNDAGRRWLADVAGPLGFRVVPVRTNGCLHLKTAVTAPAPDLLLLNPAWVDARPFGDMRRIEVAPDEPFAANALRIGARVIHPAAFARTGQRLRAAGLDVLSVDVSELARAEGGVTCCSIIIDAPAVAGSD